MYRFSFSFLKTKTFPEKICSLNKNIKIDNKKILRQVTT